MTDRERLLFTVLKALTVVRGCAVHLHHKLALHPFSIALTTEMKDLEWLVEEIDKTLDRADTSPSVLHSFDTGDTVQE